MAPLPDSNSDLARQVAALSAQIDAMSKRMDEKASTASSRSFGDNNQRPRLKLDVPRFDGGDTHGWIFKISQFFTYHQTPDDDRITIASFYLDGATLAWYQWMFRNNQIVNWNQFLTELENRFAPTTFDDPRGNLFKLTQTTTVAAYLTEFEALANRLVGLSQADLLSCFISGLKVDVRREVLTQQPRTISQAASLARLQEDKQLDLARAKRSASPWSSNPSPRIPFKGISEPASSARSSPGLLPAPLVKPRFRHLSGPEMDERREKGLCFNCDQRWSRSHKCGARVFLLVANDTDYDPVPDELEHAVAAIDPGGDMIPANDSTAAQLSFHALSGEQASDTFRVSGLILAHVVRVLVDGGSTHNFIKDSVARSLGLTLDPIPPFRVLVGSGQELCCSSVIVGVPLVIQGHTFPVDLFVLGLGGTDVVLGA